MTLRETYVSNLAEVPKGARRIFVMRRRGHDELAPSDALFHDFKKRERLLRGRGLGNVEAHNRAWDDVRFERRFAERFWNDPRARDALRAIAERARKADVWLVCYEKSPKKCHRSLLLEYAERL